MSLRRERLFATDLARPSRAARRRSGLVVGATAFALLRSVSESLVGFVVHSCGHLSGFGNFINRPDFGPDRDIFFAEFSQQNHDILLRPRPRQYVQSTDSNREFRTVGAFEHDRITNSKSLIALRNNSGDQYQPSPRNQERILDNEESSRFDDIVAHFAAFGPRFGSSGFGQSGEGRCDSCIIRSICCTRSGCLAATFWSSRGSVVMS